MAPSRGQTPRYRELAMELRAAIIGGELAPGALVPPESELAERYEVSRNTVRDALSVLVNEGLITAGRGRCGRRVRDRLQFAVHGSRSRSPNRADECRVTGVDTWVADVSDQGHTPGQRIETAIMKPGEPITRRLEIEEGAAVVVRRRLRTVDGAPHNLNDSYYPLDIAEGTAIMYPDDVKPGVTALMRELGHEQVRYRDELFWRMPTPEEIGKLNVEDGVPALLQVRTAYTTQRPARVTITTLPGDRASMVYELPA
ncbi:GntR family transcriptional regulator [Actinomadura rubrisoli]|uniref:GntR family transcriptional regulator n=1 Tax=Actinomadura rubrisoli TaxID=2530368 RepID=A0A4R5CAS2_9ACTN|nr:GntR family transcriptional regulator [Actinomadura rubrisoli]TDD95300.1 GntR family transcriptional regulator [Actinomadura rubrisoli]